MIKHLQAFMRGIQGIPFGERIMPGYIFANRDQRGTSTIDYLPKLRGDQWWYERVVRITRPNATDEIHSQWFGGYLSEGECLDRIGHAKKMDLEFSELG
jgi:hypothetical protein